MLNMQECLNFKYLYRW